MAIKWTTKTLFDKIVSILEEKGFIPEDLLDYTLADKYSEIAILTEEWELNMRLEYGGNEGIYLNVSIAGNFNPQIEDKVPICMGTFKTLSTSDEAMLKMAELEAHFIIETTKFANSNLDDFNWYGGDVLIVNEGEEPKGYLSCGAIDRAYLKANEYNENHKDDTSFAIIRDNTTRKFYYADKKSYKK